MLKRLLASAALVAHAALVTAAGTTIAVDTYTDNDCNTASTTAANVSLALDVCAVTVGMGSFIVSEVSCPNGNVKAYAFTDDACGQQSVWVSQSLFGCYEKTNSGAIAAIMLSCNQQQPDSPTGGSTTINVGPVATSGASGTTVAAAPSPSTTSSSNTGTGSGSAGGSGSGGSTTTTGSGSSSSATSPGPAALSGWNSLDSGTRISIIVSLAVGIPGILISAYMCWLKMRKKPRERW